MSIAASVQANHCKVKAIVGAHDLAITLCCSSHGQAGRAHCECVEKFASCNHWFLTGGSHRHASSNQISLQKVFAAVYWPSFFSGSRGSGGSIGLRGSIWSRMAVL